jgi:hypothetical protein
MPLTKNSMLSCIISKSQLVKFRLTIGLNEESRISNHSNVKTIFQKVFYEMNFRMTVRCYTLEMVEIQNDKYNTTCTLRG